jgi:AraC-like DNA-binding protein
MHLAEPLSLARISREAGSSVHHFVRLFQAYGGETPFEFTRRIRLITALRMLQEDPDASITEIAMSIGYDTSAAFNKTFRKHLALTPSEFRNAGKRRAGRGCLRSKPSEITRGGGYEPDNRV